jgi:hypothetical protein
LLLSALVSVTSKTRNGQKSVSEKATSAKVRKTRGQAADDDVMSVIENNGEVTIPKAKPLLTKKEIAIVAAFGVGILALVLARIANG